MLHLIFVVHQNCILDKLSLQEAFLVNWAVKKALVAQVPKEVHRVIFSEEVLGEGPSKVCYLVTE